MAIGGLNRATRAAGSQRTRLATASTAARASLRARAGVAGRHDLRRGRRCAIARGLRLQLRDHVVDLAPRLAHLGVELLVQAACGTSPRAAAARLRAGACAPRRLRSVSRSRDASRCSCSSARRSRSIFARCSASCASRALRFSRAAATTDGLSPSRAGDFERQAAARRAVHQLVGRRERLGVEAERRAGDARRWSTRRSSARRSGWWRSPSRRAGGSDRRWRRRARRPRSDRCPTRLRRAAPAPASSSARSIDAMLAMCAENVLRLASIDCSSPMSANSDRKTGSARSVGGGNPQAGLRHQRQQAGGLERDRLAAGVRSGDQQNRRRRNDLDRDRHRRS